MTAVGRDLVSNYVGKKPSLLILEWGNTATAISIGAFLYGGSGAVTAGPLKLAQRVTIELLTIRGSIPFAPDRGTRFLSQLYAGNLRTRAQLEKAFAQSAYEIRDNLTAEETDDLPNDERFRALSINTATAFRGFASLDFTVTPLAGRSPRILLPLVTTPSLR